MVITKLSIPEVLLIEPDVYTDDRGYFMETFNLRKFEALTGIQTNWVQDNESKSTKGVLRGLHFQKPPMAQAKLVRVISGKVLDVAVDIRQNSPTFGQHIAVELSEDNKLQMYIPRGFAHGFLVLSETAVFNYKCDNYYSPEHESGVYYGDEKLGIDWGIKEEEMIVSEKDKNLKKLQF